MSVSFLLRGDDIELGAAISFTDYSIAPTDLAVALEQRGSDSLWVAEHSHMPVTRRFTHPLGGGGDLPAASRERSAADGARHFKKAVAIFSEPPR